MNQKNSVVITSASRTAVGSLGKALKNVPGDQLGATVISELIKKSNLEKNDIEEVIMGQVLTGGTGQNPARQAAMKSGIPKEKPAYIVNQVCGSGIRSVASGFQSIKSGDSKIVISGGQENMSLAPHFINLRDGKKLGDAQMVDSMIRDGLWDAFHGYHMGVTAENVATKFQVTRDDQDKFALSSQEKALKAQKENKFKEEIVNLKIKSKKAEIDFNIDEHPREGINLEALSRLKPVFKKDGTVTAGNASGINDGAAGVVIMSEEESKKRKLKKLVSIKSWASCGVDPALMGTGPIPASKKALDLAGWSVQDVDLFEVNEAFAAQSIAVLRTLSIPEEKVNVNGGAIALGHPIGASGTRILVTLIHEMIRRNVNKGLATLCIGGGMGIAMCIER
ncbi:MAG: acetyl-CoA C-acyltransferase [Candidatus Pelagibacter sp.]|nr:acetyl-CoA C-acyltransferase [Candidatus Pelagibacter sp.]RPG10883.1 MAG: acetyl-CoA C-acetyltransferase [Pelagibacteraceae bacterium TMED170]|tara:strand:+ start:260 stop:1441 length:1182 start_codon:yes stop_codon:yes gene_type:complete